MEKQIFTLFAILLFSPLMFPQGAQSKMVEKTLTEIDSLQLGEELLHGDISVKFIRVISDSRCPKSVACIWEGEAEILLGITFNRNYFEKHLTVTGSTSEVLEIRNSQISVLYLNPYPVRPKKINPTEYFLGLHLDTAP